MVKRMINFGKGNTAPILIGLDVGYGYTKAAGTQGGLVVFPSIMGQHVEGNYQDDDLARLYPGDLLMHDGETWVIGKRADKFLKASKQWTMRGRTVNEEAIGNIYRLRFALAAIGKLLGSSVSDGDVVHVKIATGLPVDHMPGAPDLKAVFKGTHRVQTDAADFVVNIGEVYVMPQPYGTIYANTLTETGDINECHTARRTGVVDIGTYTVDLALDDANDYVDDESGTVEAGVHLALEYVQRQMERRYGQKFPLKDAEQVLRDSCYTLPGGKSDDFTTEVKAALNLVKEPTLRLMREKWQAGKRVGTIYLTGGIAKRLHRDIQGEYEQTVVSDNPQADNARGFLNYALAVEREG